ncbi:mediator complex subunit 2-domain-containing protein [Scheffersomyces xylosifermentans]|uniref:mediator complex subunit 2-domain-containing protein n=1 Tax=Scheffersomyces xylosifermentans TaxID=1304137 RepID=UPI00315CA0F4
MNLQTKLDSSLNDILKTSGYIFEIINNNKKQSNLITGTNNQLITPAITAQLASNIAKFDDILDETLSKLNDTRWCLDQIIENKQRQEELKLKEEMERQKKLKEEEERKRKDEERRKEEEEAKRRKEEEEAAARAKAEKEAADRAKAEEQAKIRRELEEKDRKAREEQEKERQRQEEEDKNQDELQKQQNNDFNQFISPFGFDLDSGNDKNSGVDIPNPVDMLSSINYNDPAFSLDSLGGGEKSVKGDEGNGNDDNLAAALDDNEMNLELNNLLGTDESILDGLDMSLLDQGYEVNVNDQVNNDDFDVDNFLNQFGGSD